MSDFSSPLSVEEQHHVINEAFREFCHSGRSGDNRDFCLMRLAQAERRAMGPQMPLTSLLAVVVVGILMWLGLIWSVWG